MRSSSNDPSSLPLDLPPPLALNLKVKYPDIYNRYRKLKGPLTATKPLKSRRAVAKRERQPTGDGVKGISAGQGGVEQKFGEGIEMSDELAELASQGHVDLAQALLKLPRGGQDGEQVHLDEAMLRMARIGGGAGQADKTEETAWEDVNM